MRRTERSEIISPVEKSKIQNTKQMAYKVFNLKDLLAQIQYSGVRKGTKTEAYLEDVIMPLRELSEGLK